MSWSRLAAAITLAILAAGLAGCGFRPLLGPSPHGYVGGAQALAAVEVAAIADRPGQMLRGALLEKLPQGRGKAFLLEVRYSETESASAIEKDASITRTNLKAFADLALRRSRDGEVVMTRRLSAGSAFNSLRDQFANNAAKADARARSIELLAQNIVNHLSIYFSQVPAEAAAGQK